MRLNLFIAKSGYISRRKADGLIKEGEVKVNNKKILKPFLQVSNKDKVEVGGKALRLKEHIYILFNKPKGVTTTLSDKFAFKKVIDFFPRKFKGIYPVGRLDKQSSGLLILTNDGDFCYRLTHPKFSIEKEYSIELAGQISFGDCQRAKNGLNQDGEHLKVKSIRVLSSPENKTLCKVVISEGKKRHLRRLFKALGFPVRELKRVRIGRLVLGSLKTGEYRLIREEKIYSLFCI
ncbi:MAG: rRNA pseudouridine synthase [Candidatus Omnitrophica bacterium]|nr:rRNA pseudouridine synthase [Candidatus Omnitrophota bacterium]